MLRTVQTLTIFVIFGSLALLPWGAIEGRWLPVMGNLAISDPRPYPPPDYRTKWNGTAVKLRNCEWLRTEWYLGDRNGGRVRVNFEHLDPPQVRTPGQLSWAGMLISLDEESVARASHSDVIHKCHGLWETRTPWFN